MFGKSYFIIKKNGSTQKLQRIFQLDMNENTTWFYTTGHYDDEDQDYFFTDMLDKNALTALRVVTILQVSTEKISSVQVF